MAIIYKKMKHDEVSILPEIVVKKMNEEKGWVFCAIDTDKDKWCACLMLSMTEGIQDMMQLQGLYVKPTYRNENIGKCLLNYAINVAISAGVRSFFYKEITETRGMLWASRHICASMGFHASVIDEHIVYYDAKTLKDNENINKVIRKTEKIPIVKLTDYNDIRLRKLKKKINSNLYFLENDIYDLEYSRFYVDKDKILAVAFVKSYDEREATFQGIYFADDCPKDKIKIINPILMVHCINSILDAGYEKLYLTIQGDTDHDATVGLLGEPDGDYYAIEWIKNV